MKLSQLSYVHAPYYNGKLWIHDKCRHTLRVFITWLTEEKLLFTSLPVPLRVWG